MIIFKVMLTNIFVDAWQRDPFVKFINMITLVIENNQILSCFLLCVSQDEKLLIDDYYQCVLKFLNKSLYVGLYT